jgi:hypothetical protein
MQTIELAAGSTFSFAGPVSNLPGSVAWGLAASVRVSGTQVDLDQFATTIAQAADFETSGNWNVSLTATAAQTAAWAQAAQNQRGELFFDMKFFNTAAPDPVLRSDLVKLKLFTPVTP